MSDVARSRPAASAPGSRETHERLVDAWCAADHAAAFLEADHGAVEATRSLRALVVDALTDAPPAPGRDLLHGFAAVGRLLAERGASPTLVACSVDGLASAIGEGVAAAARATLRAGRAAMVETYARTAREAQRDESLRAWEYPACVVPLGDERVAIAAGHPEGDAEALVGWASRLAHALSLRGVRHAVVAGAPHAVVAVEEALEVAGIDWVRAAAAVRAERSTKPSSGR